MTRARAAALAVTMAAALAACGKPEAPKVDAATERAEALERAKKDVFGAQVQAHEKARALGDDMNRKAQEALDAADKMSR
jgi:hypothetical protein